MINKKVTKKAVAMLAIATAVVTLAACGKKIRDSRMNSEDRAGGISSTSVSDNERAQSVSNVQTDAAAAGQDAAVQTETGAAGTAQNVTENAASDTSTNTSTNNAAVNTNTNKKETAGKTESKSSSSKKAAVATSGNAAKAETVKSVSTSSERQEVAETAKSLVGTKFEYAGVGPDKFDNSGFVYYCFKANGIAMPRMTSDIAKTGKEITLAEAQPGDILVFSNEIGGPADFVGIYNGGGKFIASFNPEKGTQEKNLAGYWDQRLITVRRA